MLNGDNLLTLDLAGCLQGNRGARVKLFAAEKLAAWHHQMDSGIPDTGQGGD